MLRAALTHTLLVPTDINEHLVDLAHAAAPSEVVGILGGVGNRVHEVIELTNQLQDTATRAPGATSVAPVHPGTSQPLRAGEAGFRVDPREQFRAERALAALDHVIVAIYHSHPGGGPTLSPRDIAYARRWPVVHVVIAVRRPGGRPDVVRAYAVTNQIEIVRIQQT
jgi:proteasome lid subunit RPN8/RPN11